MNISHKNIKQVDNEYTIVSSTESKKNCIIVFIKLTMYLLGSDNQLYDAPIEFLVAKQTIQLADITIGMSWLEKHEANLNFKNKISLALRLRNNKA